MSLAVFLNYSTNGREAVILRAGGAVGDRMSEIFMLS